MDPVAAARGAARYLHQAYDMLGNWAMAVTSYNHGIKGMLRAKAQYGDDFNRIVEDYDSRTFGFASRNFYAEFLAVRDIVKNRDRYFPQNLDMKHPLALDSVVLDRPIRSRILAHYYGVKYSKLVALNPAWTRRTVRGITRIPAGVEVWLPAGTLNHADEDGATASGGLMRVSFPQETTESSQSASLPAPVSVFHIVRRNESLSTIAFHYGLSVATLRALNDIPARKSRIYVGQKLRVRDAVEPVVGGKDGNAVIHVVRRGDSLSVIAVSYGVPMRELLDANQLTRRSTLYPGQRLEIPVEH